MKTTDPVHAARIERLPAIKAMWAKFAAQSEKEGLAGSSLPCRAGRARNGRPCPPPHRASPRRSTAARWQTLTSFDFDAVPMISKAQVMALTAGDSWLEKGANLLLFGPPGAGKSHLAAAIGLALVDTDGGCCSCAPAISSSACKSRAANRPRKRARQARPVSPADPR